jgi:predicted house-cleaning noncanonical NTP pyrophosphatase (MazG superfamily)
LTKTNRILFTKLGHAQKYANQRKNKLNVNLQEFSTKASLKALSLVVSEQLEN